MYRDFIYYRTYSRYLDNRREHWHETVTRYMDYMKSKTDMLPYDELESAILSQDVLPSMRLLWSAGDAVEANHASAYNCAYLTVDSVDAFAEALFLLTSGCGVGFSCEGHIVRNLPKLSRVRHEVLPPYIVGDSREGWADALKYCLSTCYGGYTPRFDYSQIRPKGSRLHTFGGRASGPEPLRRLFDFIIETFNTANYRSDSNRLLPIEVHDIMCKIGEVVVAGGTRRSSLISLSDISDSKLRHAKNGDTPPHRYMSNNSVAYNCKPDYATFCDEWEALRNSGSGERGIFNRQAAIATAPYRRQDILEAEKYTIGTNPCGEITLRNKQLCNLTTVVIRPADTVDTIDQKVRLATILGTFQSTLTDFTYLSPEWKRNCEAERLLGVSLTGIYDNPISLLPSALRRWRSTALKTNERYSLRLGINNSSAITCIKPSGTVSQLTDSASGAHPRYAPYYVRRVRISAIDPLFHMLKDQNFPYFPENGQNYENADTYVLEFPISAPKNATNRHELTALQQLNDWKTLRDNFTEHTVSATIYVATNEWDEVRDWVYDHFDTIGGLSFLPKEDENHKYSLAPYEEISYNEYLERMAKQPDINFAHLTDYEQDDHTTGAKEYACIGDKCEL